MKAAVYYGPRDIRIEDVPTPTRPERPAGRREGVQDLRLGPPHLPLRAVRGLGREIEVRTAD